jgi:hypothetical protein
MNPFLFGNPAGIGQQTRAGQIIVATSAGNGMRGTSRKRKASRKTAARTRRASPAKRATKRGGRARLVKGSAAAKAYMAKIRRKRR